MKTRNIIICLIILISFLLFFCLISKHIIVEKVIPNNVLDRIEIMGISNKMDKASFAVHRYEDKNEYVNKVFFNEYIVQEGKGRSLYSFLFNNNSSEIKYDKDFIFFTNIATQKIDKEICLNDLIKYDNGEFYYFSLRADLCDGKRCLWIDYGISINENEVKKGYAVIDIDSMNIEEEDSQNSPTTIQNYDDSGYYSRAKYNCSYYMLIQNESFIKANGLRDEIVHGIPEDNANWAISFQISDIQENDYLLECFPEIEDKLKEKSDEYITFVFSYDTPIDDVVKLYIPNNENVSYDDVFIEAEVSIDGESHFVKSYEEYMSYLDKKESSWLSWVQWYDK